ncbi:hypothetical protein GOBAR_DD09811 [Gossypium barbadense]|nr:hypothetical protein GOBAR_DD09811 [Gossypium barbadense]
MADINQIATIYHAENFCNLNDEEIWKKKRLEKYIELWSLFNLMSELLNQKSSILGKVPSGYLNSIFDLSGNWLHDAADTKTLAFDGYFISLYYLHLTASPLVLNDRVKKSVPPHWDPAALSRQNSSSTIPISELRGYLEDLGDVMFSDGKSPSLIQRKSRDGKQKVPDIFNRILQSSTMQLASIAETSSVRHIEVLSH